MVSDALFVDAIHTLVLISVVPVGLCLVVGLAMSVFQAATQIQEQTLSFIPKLIAVVVALYALGGWVGERLVEYQTRVLEQITELGEG